ncbi:MAG: leucyl aminopeptidase [Alphaproteobacteria bacterium]|nr:leucyl aminopeptidase [Alphaproteobacteria bacterium]
MEVDIQLSEKMEKWADSVEFKESYNLLSSDVIIIVTHNNDLSLVENILQDINVNKSITDYAKNLEYGKSKHFNFVLNNKLKEVIIISAGSKNTLSKADVEKLGGYIYPQIETDNAKVSIVNNIEMLDFEDTAAYITSGIILKSWIFDKYFTRKITCKVSSIICITNYVQINENKFRSLLGIDDCVLNVRSMVTEPANVMNSETIKDIAKELKNIGVEVRIIDQKEMAKMGMNALLGVNKGSDNPPYTIVMEYMNGYDDSNIVALVGKGVTFDAGGICLKPANRMSEMKGDMTGAAIVLNTVKSLALQKSKVNVIGAIGVVENVISSSAQRPGDVVQAMSGTTIEVDNTDAEGRLVLADVLWHVQERYGPNVVIDFATLTGAIQVALGHEFAGYMSNSDELSQHLEKASRNVGEKIWRLPLHKSYEPDIKSEIADIKNVGCGRGAGSITAAMFLQHFIKKTTKWAHIDIAATEWDSKDRALSQKGATGFGVRLMNDFIKSFFSR